MALGTTGCQRTYAPPGATEQPESAQGPSLKLSVDDALDRIDVTGLLADELTAFERLDESQRAAVLKVYVASDVATDVSPIAGSVSASGDRLRFVPRYPLAAGLKFRLVLDRALLSGELASSRTLQTLSFSTPPAKIGEPARVEHIYPTTNEVPENHLRFYIHFSEPMSRGEAYRHIHLFDAAGHEVDRPFLELGEELWDPTMRRFTLLCDPGRVKRGLRPREEVGPVLEEGNDYTLVIDRDWLDAAGNPLEHAARKTLHALAPLDEAIDPAAWTFDAPKAGTRDPLAVRFPRPLDHALLERMLWVTNSAGEKTSGAIEIADRETTWRLVPAQAWQAGDYQLVANAELEDLCGNAIGRPFEVDVFEPVQRHIETKTVSVPFKIAP